MADPAETWSERFEREFEAIVRLIRRRPIIALIFLAALSFYAWHQFLKEKEVKSPDKKDEVTGTQPAASGASAVITERAPIVEGMTAWVYVGTRIDGKWVRSQADGREPSPTLDVVGLPQRGGTYKTLNSLHLREAPPIQTKDRSRPPMRNSKGTIAPGTVLKVDDISEVEVDEIEFRTWIWAHVTVIDIK